MTNSPTKTKRTEWDNSRWKFYADWVGEILDRYREEGLPESDAEGHSVDDLLCDLIANLGSQGTYF